MKKSLEKGALDEGLLILAGLCIVIFVFILPAKMGGKPVLSLLQGPPYSDYQVKYGTNAQLGTNGVVLGGGQQTNGSPQNNLYKYSVHITGGNASYSTDPADEYLTISNQGAVPLNITGWRLKNAKDTRAYAVGSSLEHFAADVASIPQGTTFLSPTGNNSLGNITLGTGENAVITTGSVGVKTPYQIVSFKENECTGYIEGLPDYTFSPSLNMNCPQPGSELGVSALDTKCQNFIGTLQSCGTPVLNPRVNGAVCEGCVNGQTGLSSACVAFIKNHFNYAGCVANHASDPNFYGNTWRIFLGQSWELWASSHETITILDSLGRTVDSRSY